jgi:adenylylsulfate kinase-like enzyme
MVRKVILRRSLEPAHQPQRLPSRLGARIPRRARANEIADFTGVSSPFEAAVSPELVVDTEALDAARAAALLVDYVERQIGQIGVRS